MTCNPLADTGLAASVLAVAVIAVVCILVGSCLLLAARRRRAKAGATLVALVILCCGGMTALIPSLPATASPSDCATADSVNNTLTIRQTSKLENIGPGTVPAEIAGLVVNNSLDSTYITAIEAEVVSVSTHPGSPAGRCDATDYVLLNPRMAVNRTLGPGASTAFRGASLGFNDKSTNQDACKRATVHLRYATVPE